MKVIVILVLILMSMAIYGQRSGEALKEVAVSEVDAAKKIAEDIIFGNTDLFNQYISSSETHQFEELVRYLDSGESSELSGKLLAEMNMNSFDQYKFIEALNKNLIDNPQKLTRLKSSLEAIKKHYTLKGMPLPTPKRCAGMASMYIAFRDYVHSSKNHIWNNDPETAEYFNTYSKGFVGLTGLLCISELIAEKPVLARYVTRVREVITNKSKINTLNKILDNAKSDPSVSKIVKNKEVLDLSLKNKQEVVSQTFEFLMNETDKTLASNIDKKFKKYLSKLKSNQDFMKFLSPEQQERLFAVLRSKDNAPEKMKVLKELEDNMIADFAKWMQANGEGSTEEILDQIRKMRLQNEENFNLPHKMKTSTKACLVGGAFSGLLAGSIAAYGIEEDKNFDLEFEMKLRENRDAIFYGVLPVVSATCLYGMFRGGVRMRQAMVKKRWSIDKQAKDGIYLLESDEWKKMESSVLEAKKKASRMVNTGTSNESSGEIVERTTRNIYRAYLASNLDEFNYEKSIEIKNEIGKLDKSQIVFEDFSSYIGSE